MRIKPSVNQGPLVIFASTKRLPQKKHAAMDLRQVLRQALRQALRQVRHLHRHHRQHRRLLSTTTLTPLLGCRCTITSGASTKRRRLVGTKRWQRVLRPGRNVVKCLMLSATRFQLREAPPAKTLQRARRTSWLQSQLGTTKALNEGRVVEAIARPSCGKKVRPWAAAKRTLGTETAPCTFVDMRRVQPTSAASLRA